MTPIILAGIACSDRSEKERIACVRLLSSGPCEFAYFSDLWNREAKCRAAILSLKDARLVTIESGLVRLCENEWLKFLKPAPTLAQKLLPEDEPGLEAARADMARVGTGGVMPTVCPPDGAICPGPRLSEPQHVAATERPENAPAQPASDALRLGEPRSLGPSSDGRPVLSGTGQSENPVFSGVLSLSCPGQDRPYKKDLEVRSSTSLLTSNPDPAYKGPRKKFDPARENMITEREQADREAGMPIKRPQGFERALEAELMQLAREVTGERNMARYGWWWAMRIWWKPQKVRRVLLAVREDMRNPAQKIGNPGGHGCDLWYRFGDRS